MELTKRPNSDPNFVTNGLLVSEMMSGQMQLGDNTFVQRLFNDIRVAGDPEGDPNTPTYTDFDRYGLLKPGSSDSSGLGDRTGGLVDETLSYNQAFRPFGPLPTNVKYAKYIPNTHHNIADVFYNFFLAAPLGEAKWLPVMGFPISEAYWITATVAGKNQLVLAQMFERRALTYTPANPSGFQVEMANVGQHYYQWRYGTSLHSDTLPGNYRLLLPQGQSLLSSSVYKQENFKVGDAPQFIRGVWPSSNSVAVVDAGQPIINASQKTEYDYISALYAIDLTKPGQFTPLPFNPGVKNPRVKSVNWSPDGSKVAVTYDSRTDKSFAYEKTVVTVYYFVGSKLTDSVTNYNNVFSATGGYGRTATGPNIFSLSYRGDFLALSGAGQLIVLSLGSHGQQKINLPSNTIVYNAIWMDNIFPTLMLEYSTDTSPGTITHKIAAVDTYDNKLIERGSADNISDLSVSPDGNILAVLMGSGTDKASVRFLSVGGSVLSSLNLPVTVASYSGRAFTRFAGWAGDSSYLALASASGGPAGSVSNDLFLVAPEIGKILNTSRYNSDYLRSDIRNLVAPYYIVNTIDQNYPIENGILQRVSVRNADGSDTVTLFQSNQQQYRLDQAKVVQVLLTR